MGSSTDRIERKILLSVPRSWVWRALSQAGEFGKPTTLVVFELEDTDGCTLLTVVESNIGKHVATT